MTNLRTTNDCHNWQLTFTAASRAICCVLWDRITNAAEDAGLDHDIADRHQVAQVSSAVTLSSM